MMAAMPSFTSELAQDLAPGLLERFLRYVRIDTESRRDRERSPSTPGQLDLSRLLVDELQAIGLSDAVLDPASMPELAGKSGHDLVTSSGDTLLGADDKAGVAEIMTAVAHLAAHPELPRPTLRICFTPDEEIGEGATLFDVEAFGAHGAYTLDGSTIGELQDETFTAAEVTLTVTGI